MSSGDSRTVSHGILEAAAEPSASVDTPSVATALQHLNGGSRRGRKAYRGRSGRELSTSAAKRQSVMALGSIKHLQHMYAKTGLASSSPSRLGNSGRTLPLALPGQVLSETDEFDLPEEDFPASPSPPTHPVEKSFEVQMTSTRLQRGALYRELAQVCEKWGLVEMDRRPFSSSRRESSIASTSSGFYPDRTLSTSPTPSEPPHHDPLVLTLINSTTSAIRAAQRYFLTLSPEKLSSGQETSTVGRIESTSHITSRGLPSLGAVTASRPLPRHSTVGVAAASQRVALPESQKNDTQSNSSSWDPLLRLRKASLATLGSLKEMEFRYRLQPQDPAYVEDLSELVGDMSIAPTDTSFTHPSFQIEDTSASERGGNSDISRGHLYRNDVLLRDLHQEAQVVKEWIETANDLLSHIVTQAKTTRARTKSGNLDVETSPVPRWARVALYQEDRLSRLTACLDDHLTADLRTRLYSVDLDDDLLYRLSDGQLLCHAYNSVLQKSERPWGFIPQSSIHDVISLTRERQQKEEQAQSNRRTSTEDATHLQVGGSTLMRRISSEGLSGNESINAGDKTRIGFTFRRFENLRVFVAAIKLRYLIQLSTNVDTKVIARKETGWREMLQEIACTWVEAAAEEKRNEELDSE